MLFTSIFIIRLLGIVRESTDGSISLINVPIVTPNCEVIVPSLTVHVSNFNIYIRQFHTYIHTLTNVNVRNMSNNI